jgi:FkbM family methyltransferase
MLLNLYADVFGRPRFANFNKFLLSLGHRGLGIRNFRPQKLSGEIPFAMAILSKIDSRGNTLLDIGAHEGTFTSEVLKNTKYLNLVAIEPNPLTFERLSARFENNDRVRLVNVGAGDEETTLHLYDYCDVRGSSHASFIKGVIENIHKSASSVMKVKVRRLDDMVSENKINVVFIKIDVEGFELRVLKGLERTIRMQRVPYILLEFNEMNAYAGTFLKDLMDFLSEYEPFRILPRGRLLSLRPYRAYWVEVFAYQNIAFIRKDFVFSSADAS